MDLSRRLRFGEDDGSLCCKVLNEFKWVFCLWMSGHSWRGEMEDYSLWDVLMV